MGYKCSMSDDRNEAADEQLDRKYNDLLQELRVMQTGAQLTAGFLLTLPFTTRFPDLDGFQRALYLSLVLIAGVTTALVMSAVAVHRRLSGEHVKERLVTTAHRLTVAVLTTISLLVVGIVVLIFDFVVGRAEGLAFGAAMALVVLGLMIVLPLRVVSGDAA